MIREIGKNDLSQVVKIYNHYIKNTIVSFEEEVIDQIEMLTRIEKVLRKHNWYVYEENKEILGYAYSSEWNPRSAYRKTAEVSIYLHHQHLGKGIGTQLYGQLIKKLQEEGYHTLIGGISLPNPGSVAIHEKFGFQKSAHYKEVGFKFGKWVDVGYWQLFLD